jgi:enolase
VQAACELASGARAAASVPSGASTGSAEALELRDGDPGYFRGLGCRRAVGNINGELRAALLNRRFKHQSELDQALIDLDGTPDKSRLGANALLAVSLAFARAAAIERGLQLYQYFADLADLPLRALPRLVINLFSGGKHAGGQSPIQDVLIVPALARSIDAALAAAYEVYQAAAELSLRKYGMRALTADEGGLAPPFPDAEAMLEDALAAIRAAGLTPGADVHLAIDVAASHLFAGGGYALGAQRLDSGGMINLLGAWAQRFPLVSIEDGLHEEDWDHWPALRRRLSGRALTVGDDLLCTNPQRIRRAIEARAADALLLKVNQVGTLTEAAEAHALARSAGWSIMASARSGETEDNWLADLAAGWSADQIKIGSITQSERLAKYNRLLAIEAETGLPVNGWPH